MSIISSRYGEFRIVEEDSVVCKSLKAYGEWAQREIDFLASLIKPGSSVADVGAFIGTHSRAFSVSVGSGGNVYSFEPRQEAFDLLNENAHRANFPNIHAFQCGLGSVSTKLGVAAGSDDPANFGAFLLREQQPTDAPEKLVEVRPMDSFSIPHLDLIKIDVEGMEIEVIRGAEAIIRRDRPIIFAEVNSLKGGVPLSIWAECNQYAMYCALHPAFNPENFAENADNYFLNAVEVGALLIPTEVLESFESTLEAARVVPIKSIDDLSLVLLNKPQYYDEILKKSAAAVTLWPDKEDCLWRTCGKCPLSSGSQ